MHRAKCWNVHQVPKWPIRDRLNRLHDFGCKTMQIRSSGSPMRWRPQQSSLQPALHRTTSLVEAPYELYNHSCHMHQTKFHIIQIKGKKIRPRAARLRGLSSRPWKLDRAVVRSLSLKLACSVSPAALFRDVARTPQSRNSSCDKPNRSIVSAELIVFKALNLWRPNLWRERDGWGQVGHWQKCRLILMLELIG